MTSINFILISLLTSQVMGASLLEMLLDSTINSAMCEARCRGLEVAEDARVCLEVCEMVTRNPRTASVCGMGSLCTEACQLGCGETLEAGDIRVTSLEQDGCGLIWELETETEDKVIFLVSGMDSAGMISLVSSSLEERRLVLTSAMRERFTRMTVLAVGAGGLEDIKTADIEKVEAGCEIRDSETATQSTIIEERTTQNTESNTATGVDIKMIVPQISPEILVCGLTGVIFLISLLAIIILSIRTRLRAQKKHDVAFTKLEALPV